LWLVTSVACDAPKPAPALLPGASQVTPDANRQEAMAASAPPDTAPRPARKRKDPSACPKTGPVTFDDPTMETVLRRQLQKPTGPIARAELKRVKTLDLSQETRDDELDPCVFPHLTGLKGLYLAPGELDDLSLLKGATNLESLRVSATKVSDLAPLSDLRKLDRLDIGRTAVRDLKPLAGLVNLTELQIDDTEVSDVSPLAGLEKLEVLLLKRTRVSDISPLKGLRKLKHLYIEGSLVRDVTPVSGIAGLKIHEGA
jgi:internalin A